MICLFLPPHNAFAQLPDVIVTVSRTTIVQGESAKIVVEKGGLAAGVFQATVNPVTVPVEIFSNSISGGAIYSQRFDQLPNRFILTVKTFSNEDTPTIFRDIGLDKAQGIDEDTDFVVHFLSSDIGRKTANFIYRDAKGNTIQDAEGNPIEGTTITVPFTICIPGPLCKPSIRLKVRVFLEGALR